jgi:NAD+ diphosphatase
LAVDVAKDQLSTAGDSLAWRSLRETDAGRAVLVGANQVPRVAVLHDRDTAGSLSDLQNLRIVGASLSDADAAFATTAVALAQWHARHSCCPACGQPSRITDAGWSRTCEADGSVHFPRTDPAIIVLVRDRQDRALLGRRVDWHPTWFSTLAGFVEAGESAEHTLRREVFEEAGVVVNPDSLRYRGSQPWPFPGSLMLGFHAWSDSDAEPKADGVEIAAARWFSRSELVALAETGQVRIPPRVSIARHLIEDWYGGPLPGDWSR